VREPQSRKDNPASRRFSEILCSKRITDYREDNREYSAALAGPTSRAPLRNEGSYVSEEPDPDETFLAKPIALTTSETHRLQLAKLIAQRQ
jgi:hypothetical protein